MGRTYSCSFESVSVSAAQDLFQVIGAAGKTVKILSYKVTATNTTVPTSQQISLRSRFLGATVTNGSGGGTVTPKPFDPGDSAASFTCRINDTTPASSSGTVNILDEVGFYVLSGYENSFPRDRAPVVGPSESWTLEMLSTPSGTLNLSGQVIVEETGG